MRMDDLAFVGTRTTAKRDALGRGIEVFDSSKEPWVSIETLPAVNPSFLALDRRRSVLHAVHGDMSELSSYTIRHGAGERTGPVLEPLAQRDTQGTNPAHLAFDPSGNWLIVANHSSGTLASFRISASGAPSEAVDVLALTGQPGPITGDQTGSKPHQVVFVETALPPETARAQPDRAHFLVPDKGLDTVFKCAIDGATGQMTVISKIRLRQGCGPRHLAVHPHADLIYVLGELGNTVTVITGAKSQSDTMMEAVQILSTLPEDDVRDSRGGEIVLGRDGTTVWATNRSGAGDSTAGGPEPDSAAVWDIGEDGRLLLRGHATTGGIRPRSAAVDPRRPGLDIALERSHRIVRVGEESSEPRLLADVLSPVCIVFGMPAPGDAAAD